MHNIKEIYENHHNVIYSNDAVNACVELADRYITDRFFPDKAIDIMDETGSRIHLNNVTIPKDIVEIEKKIEDLRIEKGKCVKGQDFEGAAKLRDVERTLEKEILTKKENWNVEIKKNKININEEDVCAVVSKMINIPVKKITQDEGKKIVEMASVLKKRIIGQDEAVEKISEAIQRSRAGLQNPLRPIGSFLFLGNTGVGKTETAKALAEYMFYSEDSLIKIDMSEYQEPHTISRMIGSPPGYVGFEEGGQLTEKVRNKPYSVILFDELEKAHKDVSKVLLQILDEGRLTDGLGRTVNFKNTIIIMTSNVGSRELSEYKPLGYGNSSNEKVNSDYVIEKALKKYFLPEFLNRIDERIIFNKLNLDNVGKITDIHIAKITELVKKQGFEMYISEKLREMIISDGYNEEFGARPILRSIIRYIQTPVSKSILLKKFKTDDKILVDIDKKTKEIIVVKHKI